MNTQKTHKNKIGARNLTTAEAKLILPAYEHIYDQIEQFRVEKEPRPNEVKAKGEYTNQKTNNIGIIGVRGAGKTSILKTIKATLEKKLEYQDIILPIIVPENMSESSTLMATILGMLSEFIKNRDQERKNGCIEKDSLKKCCDEAIKQYTYIQKEYRSILLREYTTENDYVKSSAEVFNSDIEFIKKFNQLISFVVNPNNQIDNKNLLFLFIDDIDLSTYRCADVVKTLLSYLSNENIVTIISGDLNTFEEALTLDFLRRDNVLDGDILNSAIGENTILKSKQDLAYEYLKKILPPVYRYQIKHWSLEEKGNYCIVNLSKERELENDMGVKLSDLLSQALSGWIDPSYFCYMENSQEKKVLPYTYHLFDNTSRGLNNIYNVLSDIAAKRKEKEGEYLVEKKLLLDTIVASKPVYNQHRDDIYDYLYIVGETEKDSKVFFDNAINIIYKEKEQDERNKKESQRTFYIEEAVDRFSLFLLVDFAARLLYGNSNLNNNYRRAVEKDQNYIKLKNRAMEDLFFYPEIAERTINVLDRGWTDRSAMNAIYRRKEEKLYFLNRNFLLRGDVIFNMTYYRCLPLERIVHLKQDGTHFTTSSEQDVIISFWSALSSLAWTNEMKPLQMAAIYYPTFWEEYSYMQSRMSGMASQNVIMALFYTECDEAVGNTKIQEGIKQYLYHINIQSLSVENIKQQLSRILINTISQLIQPMIDQQDADAKIQYKKKESVVNRDMERRIGILQAIDREKLWKSEVIGSVTEYLKKTIGTILVDIGAKLLQSEDILINIKKANDSWKDFRNAYAGVSDTKFKQTKRSIWWILQEDNPENNGELEQGVSLSAYQKMCCKLKELANNNNVWYGQFEAQRLWNVLQEAFADVEEDEKWMAEHPYFVFLLQCYYKYKIARDTTGKIFARADLLADITKQLLAANEDADDTALNNFIDSLNKNPDFQTTADEFEKLFPNKLLEVSK